MTIIICPTELCNFKCSYCFQEEDQHTQGLGIKYDYDAIANSLNNIWNGPHHGSDVCLHGGECTMIGHDEFEKLCKLIYNLPWREGKVKGSVSIVTNGSLIDDRYVEIFKKYNVHVGISVDGPGDLNIQRGPDPSDSQETEIYNYKLKHVLMKLAEEGVPTNIMCILHKDNAGTPEKLRKLGKWMLWLKKLGIKGGRVNPVSSDNRPELELTNRELFRVWYNVYKWNKKYGLSWNPLIEMEKNLTGENRQPRPCIFHKCDPFNTHTLSIHGNGSIGCCDRTFYRGLYTRSASNSKSGRYQALEMIDCKDCEYFPICGGGCPEEGYGGDWRRKTRWCEANKLTYDFLKRELGLKTAPQPKKEPPRFDDRPHGDNAHGDTGHGDSSHGDSTHGDAPHGDMPHGDSSHGDMPHWERK